MVLEDGGEGLEEELHGVSQHTMDTTPQEEETAIPKEQEEKREEASPNTASQEEMDVRAENEQADTQKGSWGEIGKRPFTYFQSRTLYKIQDENQTEQGAWSQPMLPALFFYSCRRLRCSAARSIPPASAFSFSCCAWATLQFHSSTDSVPLRLRALRRL